MPRAAVRRRLWSVLSLALVSCLLAACQSGDSAAPGAGSGARSRGAVTATAPPAAAAISVSPADGSRKVRLDRAVTISVAQGTVSTVSVRASGGKALTGTLSQDRTRWTSTAALKGGSRYRVSVEAAGQDGRLATTTSSFGTLTPKRTASAWLQPGDDWQVGVGMPAIVNFTAAVTQKNRAAVERALSVTSTPTVAGAWRWMSSEQVQWRPKTYWPAHTKVTLAADLAGVELAPGVWGTKKTTAAFRVGSSVISTVDVDAHTLTMRKDGKVVRTIPVTTGKASMATRNGIKVIMSRETAHRMRSTSIGIDKDDPDYYDIVARYAMRLTYSGEFLHAAPWSTGSQGRANVSHGCTGMSTADARWLFNHSKVGDVVVYRGSSRALEWGNGYTAWNQSWSSWKA